MTYGLKLSEDLRSLTDLKRQASEVVDQAQRTGRPVVLTRHGRGVAVLLSIEAYEELEAVARSAERQVAVDRARREYESGEYIDGDAVDERLASWAADE